MILNEEFVVDLDSCFALGKGDRPLCVTSDRYIPIKNQLDWSTVVFCACELIQLYSVSFFTVRGVHKIEFKLFINKEGFMSHSERVVYF